MKHPIAFLCVTYLFSFAANSYCGPKVISSRECVSDSFITSGLDTILRFRESTYICKNGNRHFLAHLILETTAGETLAIRSSDASITSHQESYTLSVNSNSFYIVNEMNSFVRSIDDSQLSAK